VTPRLGEFKSESATF